MKKYSIIIDKFINVEYLSIQLPSESLPLICRSNQRLYIITKYKLILF